MKVIYIWFPCWQNRKKKIDYLKTRCSNLPYLWLSEYGKPLGKSGIHLMIRKLKHLNPNIKISPHVFRHTFTIDLLRAGGDFYALQTLGGWENLEIPRLYSETVQQEHALKVHEKASPVDFLVSDIHEIGE